MALLNWKADYCTGNVKIDDDHRTLFERINDFHYAWEHKRDRKDIARVLNRLVEYAEEHFAREEGIMHAAGYPGLARHQAISRPCSSRSSCCRAISRTDASASTATRWTSCAAGWWITSSART